MSLQSCPTLCDRIDSSPPGSPIPGIRQARTLEWVAISFSNAGNWKVKVKSLSHVRFCVTDSVWPHRQQPTRLPCPWDSPGKNTGLGCHFLLQCMKVKSESEVAQLCPTPRNPMDYSPPGPSVHGVSQARVLEWVAIGTYKLIIKYLPGRNLLVQRRTWWEKQLILCSVTVIFIMYNWAIYQVWCSHQFPPENQEEISGRENR